MASGLPSLPNRPRNAHKGDVGRILVVAGSIGMTGAATLAAMGAFRMGAGVVTLAVPEPIYPILATRLTCTMVFPVKATRSGIFSVAAAGEIVNLAERHHSLVMGPGLTNTPSLVRFVERILREVELPAIVDADGLNLIARSKDMLTRRPAPTVMTPHEGEMSRLMGSPVEWIREHRTDTARSFAKEHGVTLLLKGRRTVISNGNRLYTNKTGNSGMATGGSGDVLAGMIGTLLAQGKGSLDAARLAAHLHGSAGELAAKELGERSVMATDLIDFLPPAIRKFEQRRNQ